MAIYHFSAKVVSRANGSSAVASAAYRSGSELFDERLGRLLDALEAAKESLNGAFDLYVSQVAHRTNDIMKTLTLVTVMFMPMSFLAGFFGMNFFGATLEFKSWLPKGTLFALVCLVTFLTPVVMWLWARRRGWF